MCVLKQVDSENKLLEIMNITFDGDAKSTSKLRYKVVFLNGRVAARYRALASIIPSGERFSWNLSF
jgi:hypothetical protein